MVLHPHFVTKVALELESPQSSNLNSIRAPTLRYPDTPWKVDRMRFKRYLGFMLNTPKTDALKKTRPLSPLSPPDG